MRDGKLLRDVELRHPKHAEYINRILLNKFVMCRIGAELTRQNQAAMIKRKRVPKQTNRQKYMGGKNFHVFYDENLATGSLK